MKLALDVEFVAYESGKYNRPVDSFMVALAGRKVETLFPDGEFTLDSVDTWVFPDGSKAVVSPESCLVS